MLPISQLNNDDTVFITPFEVLESEPKIEKAATKELSIIEQVEASIISDNTPACPKSNSEMVKRVAKKGQQQGQPFFGCSQFPKCRGVVNIN